MKRIGIKQLVPVLVAVLFSCAAFADAPNISCSGNFGALNGVTLIFTGKMMPGDFDNDYKPGCGAWAKLKVNGQLRAEGDLEAYSSMPGEIASRTVQFPTAQLPVEVTSHTATCESLGIGGSGQCLTIIETSPGSNSFTVAGHPEDKLFCTSAELEPGECQ